MSTITISRQLGSLGLEVGTGVAENLGYRLVRREVINQAARRAGAPEAALAEIDELGLLDVCPSPRACRAYHQAVQEVMEELAAAGDCVIIGRAGQVILRGRADIFHVRIIAPVPLRIERLVERYHISPLAAAARVEASDCYRRNYLKRFYHARWDDPELYDLTVNTAQLALDAAVAAIVAPLVHPLPSPRVFDPEEHGQPFFS